MRIVSSGAWPWNASIDISGARAYKPNCGVYRLALQKLQAQPGQAMHVAAHRYDLRAAQACGFRTAYIHWPGYAAPEVEGVFDFQADSLAGLVVIAKNNLKPGVPK